MIARTLRGCPSGLLKKKMVPNMWLHSSVGRASQRYRGVHGFELRERRDDLVVALIFFRLLLSNCSSWNIYCDDHSSLSSTTAVHMNYYIYTLHQNGRFSSTKSSYIACCFEKAKTSVATKGRNNVIPCTTLICTEAASIRPATSYLELFKSSSVKRRMGASPFFSGVRHGLFLMNCGIP